MFNVDEETLRRELLEPWVAGIPFEFAEHHWQPRESRLTILEGPALEQRDDAEESWAGALRAATDVTRQMLEAAEASAPARIAVAVEADSVETALKNLRAGKPPRQLPWATAVERIGSRDPDVAAVILVIKRPQIEWPDF